MSYSIYPKSDFWLNSPGLVMIKLGVVLAMLALSFLWVNLATPQRWSIFRQVGTTSLLVYWVHIELVYGRWFGAWKQGLGVSGVLIVTAVLLVLVTLLSMVRTRYRSIGSIFKPSPVPVPRRASGD